MLLGYCSNRCRCIQHPQVAASSHREYKPTTPIQYTTAAAAAAVLNAVLLFTQLNFS